MHLGEENVNYRKIEFRLENRNVYKFVYLCFCGGYRANRKSYFGCSAGCANF